MRGRGEERKEGEIWERLEERERDGRERGERGRRERERSECDEGLLCGCPGGHKVFPLPVDLHMMFAVLTSLFRKDELSGGVPAARLKPLSTDGMLISRRKVEDQNKVIQALGQDKVMATIHSLFFLSSLLSSLSSSTAAAAAATHQIPPPLSLVW